MLFYCFLNKRCILWFIFFFSSRRRHTRWPRDWSSDVCSSDLCATAIERGPRRESPQGLSGWTRADCPRALSDRVRYYFVLKQNSPYIRNTCVCPVHEQGSRLPL